MALTGSAAGPPLLAPAAFVDRVEQIADEIGWRSEVEGRRVCVQWGPALAGRSVLRGFRRSGRLSANRSCRLLDAGDGWVACNLARPDDRLAVPALTGRPVPGAPRVHGADTSGGPGVLGMAGGDTPAWGELAAAAAAMGAVAFVDRARLLGLAVARLGEVAPVPEAARLQLRWGPAEPRHPWHVVDLSALWAGPIAARILAEAGATVTKVESSTRPDPGRQTPDFYHWVHHRDEQTVTLDFSRAWGQTRLRELLSGADVVIESSRPRALEQLGAGPDDLPPRAGRVWLSITGHGRDEPMRDWVAFGDDAAVAGGLVGWDTDGTPAFLGDAVADPLTGLTGALAVLRSRAHGGGQLIDLGMSRVASTMSSGEPLPVPGGSRVGSVMVEAAGPGAWAVRSGRRTAPVVEQPVSLEWLGG
jgi:hypothetical protein